MTKLTILTTFFTYIELALIRSEHITVERFPVLVHWRFTPAARVITKRTSFGDWCVQTGNFQVRITGGRSVSLHRDKPRWRHLSVRLKTLKFAFFSPLRSPKYFRVLWGTLQLLWSILRYFIRHFRVFEALSVYFIFCEIFIWILSEIKLN